MKRVLMVLALSLMLLFSVWGEAYAADPSGGPTAGDHPWSGEDFGVDGRNRCTSGGELVGCGILPIDIILNDYVYLGSLSEILWDTVNDVSTPQSNEVTVSTPRNLRIR